MPIRPKTFAHSKPLVVARNSRAYASVVMLNPATQQQSAALQCLVDTGSDYTILPLAVAMEIGIKPAGKMISFRAAGGAQYKLPSHAAVDLMIEGYSLQAEIAFSHSNNFMPILGRIELVFAFDVGFDTNNWYWG